MSNAYYADTRTTQIETVVSHSLGEHGIVV